MVAALDCYIEKTSICRASQLLVSFLKQHNATAKSLVAGWVKQILIMSGIILINTNIFNSHSTCSASSSHARLPGLSLSDIFKRGSWSNKSTWERFYSKSIMTFEEKFQKAVVNYYNFEERRMGIWVCLLHCYEVGRTRHFIEIEILWNKIWKLSKAMKWLQYN